MRLVVCDDHLLLVEALVDALVANGHQVVAVATDPVSVVDKVVELQPDVCVLDLSFPGERSGLDAAAAIADRAPGMKILILSGALEPHQVRAALGLGVVGFVRKDSSIDGILDALESLGNGGVAITAATMQAAMSGPSDADEARPPSRAKPPATPLTPREQEVLMLVVAGNDTAEISTALHVSSSTARSHVQNVLIKLGVHSRLQAAAVAIADGLVDIETLRR